MKKTVILSVLLFVAVGTILYYTFERRRGPQYTPEQVKQLDWRTLHTLAGACEAGQEPGDCTLIMEVNALKAQKAKQGEKFWITQMLRLGDWYNRTGLTPWQPGQPEPPEIRKAEELYQWLLDNKPFHAEHILYGYARLYDSPYNQAWAQAHATQAKKYYQELQQRYPQNPYATEVTAALQRLQ